MPGEVVIGGSQDRAIGQELVVMPDQKPVPLDVFCVEHGRWGGRDLLTYENMFLSTDQSGPIQGFSANLSLVVSETADFTNSGKFVGSAGSLNKSARIAVQNNQDQQKVWDEVASENAKNRVQPPTGTFVSYYCDPESTQRLTAYLEKLLQPIDETTNIVGVVVAVNGHVESMDVFESTPLFRKLWPKLLKSYALDAANNNAAEPEHVATRAQALAFLHETANATVNRSETNGDLALSHRENERVLLFSAHQRREQDIGGPSNIDSAGLGGMSGAFGGAVHTAGFVK
jgi:hypothetical protein